MGAWPEAPSLSCPFARLVRAALAKGQLDQEAYQPDRIGDRGDARRKTYTLTPYAYDALERSERSPSGRGSGPSPDVQALIGYAGPAMTDPFLAERLGGLHLPVHVVWGESDRIVHPEYGKAYAAAIPGAAFTLLPRTGHLPQMETPEELLGALLDLGH